MKIRWLMTAALIAAFGLSFVVVDAQKGRKRRANAKKAANKPKGLNAERAVNGQEPDWWVKAKKPSLDVKETTLKNGLKVLILDHGVLPKVATYLWYDVGSKDEPAGATGVAHYLEHMMFKGSKRYKKGDVDAITNAAGGANNAFTSTDYTAYYFILPKANWTQALDIEADRMTTLALNRKEFDAEKAVVQEEIYRANDEPNDQLWEVKERLVHGPNHPYSHPVLGFDKDIANMEIRDMRRFYEKFYTPDNATLVIVGRVDPDKALEEVKKRFDAIPRSRLQAKRVSLKTHKVPEPKAPITTTLFADVGQASGMMVLPAESTASIRNPVRDVLAALLTRGENSILYKRLVVEEKLVAGVSAFQYERKLAGSFHISVQMFPEATDAQRARVFEIVEEEIKKLAAKGPAQKQIKNIVQANLVAKQQELESVDEVANSLGSANSRYGDWRFMDHYIETLKQITPRDVQHVCSLWDFEKEPVVAWLLPSDREVAKAQPISKAPELPVLDVQEVTLENGLRLLLLPNEKGPKLVSISASYEAGVRTQPADKNGLAALVGSLVAAGTEKRKREEITAAFEEIGASFSATAGGMSASLLSKDINIALEVMADVLQNANFPESQIALEKRNLLATITANADDHNALARRATARLLYGAKHPYGSASAIDAEAIKSYTRDDLMAHFKRYVAPNNTRIIVSGRFDADSFAKQAQELFGGWERSKGAEFRRTAKIEEPARNGVQRINFKDFSEDKILSDTRVVLIDHPEKEQCVCRLQRIGFKRNSPDYPAARVMDSIFGTSAGFSDRVSKTLRDELGLAYSTYANISGGSSEEPGSFLGYIGTRPSKVPQAMVKFRELIEEMTSNPVSEEELKAAKSAILAGLLLELEGNAALAGKVSEMDRFKLGYDYLERLAKDIEAVTIEDVQAVAAKYLDASKMVLVVAGPISQVPNQGVFFEAFANNAKMSLGKDNNVEFAKE